MCELFQKAICPLRSGARPEPPCWAYCPGGRTAETVEPHGGCAQCLQPDIGWIKKKKSAPWTMRTDKKTSLTWNSAGFGATRFNAIQRRFNRFNRMGLVDQSNGSRKTDDSTTPWLHPQLEWARMCAILALLVLQNIKLAEIGS